MISLEAEVKTLLPDWEVEYDCYENLFTTVVYVARQFYQKGILEENIKKERIITNHQCTRNMILHLLNVLYDQGTHEVARMMIELEAIKHLQRKDATEDEAEEMVLARCLLEFLVTQNESAIYEVISFLCSSDIYQKILVTVDWIKVEERE